MTFPESLDINPQPGFRREEDPASARRQFHVSLAVAVALALAIGGSAFALQPMPSSDLHLRPVQTSDAWLPAARRAAGS